MASDSHGPPILRIVTEGAEKFGGEGKYSGITHAVTAICSFLAAALASTCLWIATHMNDDIKTIVASQTEFIKAVSTIREQVRAEERRLDSMDSDHVRIAEHTQKQDELIISHEAKIESIREQVEALQRRR